MEKITNNYAYEETLKYFKGDDLAARVWVTKYALKDSDGNIYEKTPDDMHHRIASEIARVDFSCRTSRFQKPLIFVNYNQTFF